MKFYLKGFSSTLLGTLCMATILPCFSSDNIEETVSSHVKLFKDISLQETRRDSTCIQTQSLPALASRLENVTQVSLKGRPVNTEEEEVVLKILKQGKDGREKIDNTSIWPHSVHGVVAIKFRDTPPNVIVWGSGTLISPSLVLTAAHNLYNRKEGPAHGAAIEVRFLPAINGSTVPFPEPKVERFYYPQAYTSTGEEDYGLLVLKTPLEEGGYFGVHVSHNILAPECKGLPINVTGYPGDKAQIINNDTLSYEMWTMAGPSKRIDKDKGILSYQIDTSGGQSGSGVWFQKDDSYFVKAVHVKAGPDSRDKALNVNKATLLTPERYEQITTWIKDYVKENFRKSINSSSLDMNNIRELNFDEKSINDFGLTLFTQIPSLTQIPKNNFTNLTKLNLRKNNLTAQGITAIPLDFLEKIVDLNLEGNLFEDKGIEALAGKGLNNLQELRLGGNRITSIGAGRLANISLPRLRKLYLGRNNLGDDSLEKLADARYFSQLVTLSLRKNDISNEGLSGFITPSRLPIIQFLNFSDNPRITKPIQQEFISKGRSFAKLKSVDFEGNNNRIKNIRN